MATENPPHLSHEKLHVWMGITQPVIQGFSHEAHHRGQPQPVPWPDVSKIGQSLVWLVV